MDPNDSDAGGLPHLPDDVEYAFKASDLGARRVQPGLEVQGCSNRGDTVCTTIDHANLCLRQELTQQNYVACSV